MGSVIKRLRQVGIALAVVVATIAGGFTGLGQNQANADADRTFSNSANFSGYGVSGRVEGSGRFQYTASAAQWSNIYARVTATGGNFGVTAIWVHLDFDTLLGSVSVGGAGFTVNSSDNSCGRNYVAPNNGATVGLANSGVVCTVRTWSLLRTQFTAVGAVWSNPYLTFEEGNLVVGRY